MLRVVLAFAMLACDHIGRCDAATGEHSEAQEYETLYVLFFAILVGAAVLHMSTLPFLRALPVTVILFILGILFSLVAEGAAFTQLEGMLRSYQAWVGIDPHLLLFVFLPPLLFSSAIDLDTYVAKKCCAQCLVLAVLGVVIGSFVTAFFLHYLPYAWNFSTCLMVGSILSATDPVAVVSLLKELGASPVLTMQIEGESMLNDGTAIVLFMAAYGKVKGEECGAACMTLYFLKSTLGAWFLGCAVGMLFYLWIFLASDKLSKRSSLIQILLTICCAYWSYLLADGVLDMSGVLSSVAAGVVLAHLMWPFVVERRAMLEFWHVIEAVGTTLVFFIAGLLSGQVIRKHTIYDYLWVLAAYAALMLIRFLMLLCLLPILNRVGARVSFRDLVIMTWAGLRGMVALALAIYVREDLAGGMLSEEDGERVLLLVGGVATLTLVCNATTSPMLCGLLGITQTVEGRKVLVRNVALRTEAHVTASLQQAIVLGELPKSCMAGAVRTSLDNVCSAVKQHVFGTDAVEEHAAAITRASGTALDHRFAQSHRIARIRRWSRARVEQHEVCRSLTDVDDLWRHFDHHKLELLKTHTTVTAFKFGHQLGKIHRILATEEVDPLRLKVVREVFLEVIRSSYWEQVESGMFVVGANEPRMLFHSVSCAMDRSFERLSDWWTLEHELGSVACTHGGPAMQDDCEHHLALPLFAATPGGHHKGGSWMRWLREYRSRRTFGRQVQALEITAAFIKAHQRAQMEITLCFGQEASVDTAEEACVILESQAEIFAAATLQGKISRPVQRQVSTARETNRFCEQYRHFVVSAHARGLLQSKEVDLLLEPVTEVMRTLRRQQQHMSEALVMRGLNGGKALYELDAAVLIQRAYRHRLMLEVSSRVLHGCARAPQQAEVDLEEEDPVPAEGTAGRLPVSVVPSPAPRASD
mmetsp:Transcript_155056/g.497079  ORF Transcript_155056/g.497079 Transcript_155056/m.497079 type:complete len:927 (+) Transcript_155056:46-2826(+)